MGIVHNDLNLFKFRSLSRAAIVPKTENIGVDEEGYEIHDCEYCDQEFANLNDLMEHRDTHAELQDGHTKYFDDST